MRPVPEPVAHEAERLDRGALRDSLIVLVASRLFVLAVAVAASLTLSFDATHAIGSDVPALTHPFGAFGDRLLAPLARWDAKWYLSIAQSGYTEARTSAFFPLYPLLVRTLAGWSSSPQALLLSSYAVSLTSFGVALYVLHRLVVLELGARTARPVLLLLALWPGALFFGAPYSESLFLALSVGAFYAARTGRWTAAIALAAAASATRVVGLTLILPLAVIWWRSAHHERPSSVMIALAPAGVVAFSAYLGFATDLSPLEWKDAQRLWKHEFVGPFVAIHHAGGAAVDGATHLLAGSVSQEYVLDPGFGRLVHAQNAAWFALLVLAGLAIVGVFRRLPPEYGVYSATSILVPLAAPVGWQPLMSLPRFVSVLFPLFMWLGLVCSERRRLYLVVLGLFVSGLAGATALFATWHWFA